MKNKGDWMLLVAAFIGGGGFVSVKYLLDWGYSPYQVILGRFFVASLCLSIIYRKRYSKITRNEWKVGGGLGILLSITFLLMTIGLQYTTPSINSFLVNTPGVIVPFICWIFFKQKPTSNCFLAAILTLLGVSLLSITEGFSIDIGAMLSFGAAIAFSLQMAFMGKVVKSCDPVHIALVEQITVVVVSFVVVMLLGQKMPTLTLGGVGNFLFTGIFCTGVYFVLQSIGQQYTSPNKTAIIITTESIFTAIISALLYNEKLGVQGMIGCSIIFVAVLLAENPLPWLTRKHKISP